MISFQHIECHIPQITAILVLIISVCAFCLSFYNLQLQATEAGINPWLSWMWPVTIDALLVSGSLMVLRSSMRQEKAVVGWSVLLAFTGISTFFNVIHSPADLISRLAHAVPPVALCVSVELLMICIRSDLQQEQPATEQAPASIQQQRQTKRGRNSGVANLIQEHYKQHPDMTTSERAEALNLHRSTVSRHIKKLVSMGVVDNG